MVKNKTQLKNKKAQTSMEFIVLIGFVMLLLTVIVANFHKTLIEVQDRKDWAKSKELFNIIETEIILAESAYENYNRTFVVPNSLSGHPVNLTCQGSDDDINISYHNKYFIYFLKNETTGCKNYLKPGKVNIKKICENKASSVLRKCHVEFSSG